MDFQSEFANILTDTGGEITFLVFFLVLIFLCVAFLIGAIIYFNEKEKKYKKELTRKFNSVRNIVFDLKEQKVKIINVHKLNRTRVMTYSEFLDKLDQRQKNNINVWLTELVHQDEILTDEKRVFITDLMCEDEFGPYFSRAIFEMKQIDKEKSLVYVEVTLLRNLPCEINRIRKGEFRKDIYPISEIVRMHNHGFFLKGGMFIFSLEKKENTNCKENDYKLKILILNAVYKSKNSSNYYSFFSDNDEGNLTILYSKTQNEYQLNREMKKMMKYTKSLLETTGLIKFYSCNLVASKVEELDRDFNRAYTTLSNYGRLMKDSNKEIAIFKNDDKLGKNIEQSYKGEINRIIKNQSITINYSPIVKITNKRVTTIGYFADVKPKGTIFETIDEAKKVAQKYSVDKEFCSMILRKMIPTFNNEKENNNLKLFFSINISEISYILKSLPHLNLSSNTKVALVIENDDFVDCETDDNLFNSIATLQSHDIEVLIKTKYDDYNLRSATYSQFNGFMVDTKPPKSNNEAKDYMVARRVIDKLIKYKLPIISIDTTSRNEIELLVKIGINVFSSEVIGQASPMLVPVDKKVVKKLLAMNKK